MGARRGWPEVVFEAAVSGLVTAILGWLLVLAFGGSTWPVVVQAAAVLALVALPIVVFLGVRRVVSRLLLRAEARRARSSREAEKVARNADLRWVTFSALMPMPDDPAGCYVIAVAEVDRVDGDDVLLVWRDRGVALPTRVPIALLHADLVHHVLADGTHSYQNEGLRISHGGSVTGPGWAVHPVPPHEWIRTSSARRASDLDVAGRAAFEAVADLSCYDLDQLRG